MSVLPQTLSRRSFLKASGIASAAMVVAACAPAAPGGGAGDVPDAEVRSLTVWGHRTFAPASDDVLLGNIDQWGAENNVELEVVAEIETPTMNERLMAAIESRVMPDMTAILGGRVALHYPANVYVDVSDLYAELDTEYGGFFRPAEQTATIDGKQWVIPYSIDTALMYYRKDLLDAKGLALPTSWEEYAATMLAAQEPPDTYGAGIALNKEATDCESTFSRMLLSFGASYVADDSKTIVINSPETRDWLTFVVDSMYNQGIFPPDAFEWDNAGNNAAYQDETAISINNPASVLVWLLENKPELAEASAIQALPAGPAGTYNEAGARLVWAVLNGGSEEKQQLSQDLIRYLMEPAQFEPWIELAFAAPAVAAYEEMDVWQDPKRAGFLDAAKNGVLGGYPGLPTPASSELGTHVPSISMILRVIIDGWTVDEAVAEAEQVALDVYSKYE